MNIITELRERRERKRYRLAMPYIGEALRREAVRLSDYFSGTHKLTLTRVESRLESLKYDKPWPKGTTLDQAFELAIHEAIAIVKSEQ